MAVGHKWLKKGGVGREEKDGQNREGKKAALRVL
jgi:hypothetical protein